MHVHSTVCNTFHVIYHRLFV